MLARDYFYSSTINFFKCILMFLTTNSYVLQKEFRRIILDLEMTDWVDTLSNIKSAALLEGAHARTIVLSDMCNTYKNIKYDVVLISSQFLNIQFEKLDG